MRPVPVTLKELEVLQFHPKILLNSNRYVNGVEKVVGVLALGPPGRPDSARLQGVAVRMRCTALPMTSAGRFWRWGPLGMSGLSLSIIEVDRRKHKHGNSQHTKLIGE
jgi:hypothetical protein